MIAIVVRSPENRNTALRAARRVQSAAQVVGLAELPDFLARAHGARCLVIHDFEPDPPASLSLLRQECAAGRGFALLALIAPPATPLLNLLLRLTADFPLAGVAVVGDEGPEELALRIEAAFARGGQRVLLQLVTRQWRLDPVLARVAECELSGERSHVTLEGLLREAGVGRRRFVSLAVAQGISRPLRFLQGLRVMEAAELLQQGCTTRRVAERLGYGSLDTLRGHFRQLANLTPRAVRGASLEKLAAAVVVGMQCGPDAKPSATRARARRTIV